VGGIKSDRRVVAAANLSFHHFPRPTIEPRKIHGGTDQQRQPWPLTVRVEEGVGVQSGSCFILISTSPLFVINLYKDLVENFIDRSSAQNN